MSVASIFVEYQGGKIEDGSQQFNMLLLVLNDRQNQLNMMTHDRQNQLNIVLHDRQNYFNMVPHNRQNLPTLSIGILKS